MGARDSGWIQMYAENNQEAYDNMVQAFRISEHKDVKLPIMICQDGFITSHAVENIELLEDEEVKSFVGEYEPENYLLNPECPMAVGPYSVTDYYMEAKRNQAEGMKHVEQVVLDVAREFAELSGREYGLFEAYRLDDAERAVVMIGSAAGTTKDAIDRLREKRRKSRSFKNPSLPSLPGRSNRRRAEKCESRCCYGPCRGIYQSRRPAGSRRNGSSFPGKKHSPGY